MAAYDIINNVEIKLLDVLDGSFKVVTSNIEENKQPYVIVLNTLIVMSICKCVSKLTK